MYALGATLYHLLAGKPPHGGTSATEVLGKTLAHDLVPLASAAPGAPPELSAIVDKALAFEQATRYPDAGALGEDVRRFLAGQLVAAHRYTPQQRLARFARRHRTALAVAALASVAVAALAWFSVHRIMQERDAATAARQAALVDKQQAEAARDRLAERNDALLVTQARALLESNPTEALAVLKQLAPTSARRDDARAVAHAAVARGVWWAIESPEQLTTRAELSPDGHQLLQQTRDGVVRIWDLARRRPVLARPYTTATQAVWVSGGRVLVYGREQAAELLDPAANRSEPLALGRLVSATASDRGDRVVVVTPTGVASLFDVATGVAIELWGGRPVRRSEIAPDGRWVVLADDTTVVVLDDAGAELTRYAAESHRLETSRFRSLAVVTTAGIVECQLDPAPVWTELPAGDEVTSARDRGGHALPRARARDLLQQRGAPRLERWAAGPACADRPHRAAAVRGRRGAAGRAERRPAARRRARHPHGPAAADDHQPAQARDPREPRARDRGRARRDPRARPGRGGAAPDRGDRGAAGVVRR